MHFFVTDFLLPLGASLVIFLLSSRWPRWARFAVIAAVAIVVFGLSLTVSHFENAVSTEKPWVIAGRVEDEATREGLGQAAVLLEGSQSPYLTEDNGNFRIEINASLRKADRLRITVSKPGYKPANQTVAPPQDNYIVLLTKL